MSTVYILTVKSGKVKTRIYSGCFSNVTMFASYADACGTLESIRRLPIGRLPVRDDAEKARVESFIDNAVQFAG